MDNIKSVKNFYSPTGRIAQYPNEINVKSRISSNKTLGTNPKFQRETPIRTTPYANARSNDVICAIPWRHAPGRLSLFYYFGEMGTVC